jgi:UDP-N-acetylmuramate dehydrogenase
VPAASQQTDPFLSALSAAFGDRWRQDEPLSGHTTLRLGGPADLWLPVESVDELVTAVGLARQYRVPLFLLGSGANLLVSDAGIRGLIVENRAGQIDFSVPAGGPGDTIILTAASGVVLPGLARRCAERGLAGLEWAVGVPGTIGGAVVNNAGAYGRDMAGNLARADLLSPAGERMWQPVAWFDYDYRQSRLKRQSPGEKWVVLQAELRLSRAPKADIKARMQEFNERRKASQPPGATIGSMFKNPPGDYAGRLIEAAGLKGYQQGQARISPVHANFFQNLGGATAAEVMNLIRTARQAVKQKFGLELALEIELVGEFED